MADFAVMPKADYLDACDAIREKTGKPELIKSGEMAAEIRSIKTDFRGIKYLTVLERSYSPVVVDMRSIDTVYQQENNYSYLFANSNTNKNGGQFVFLEEVYLPNGLVYFSWGMFLNCSSLTTLHGDLSGIKYIMVNAFSGCTRLEELAEMPLLIQIRDSAFKNCSSLKSIKLMNKNMTMLHSRAFDGCTGLTNVEIATGWIITINLSWSTELTQESLHKMIENLADLTGQTSQTFQVGNTNIEKIDEEHITMLENKNWNYL